MKQNKRNMGGAAIAGYYFSMMVSYCCYMTYISVYLEKHLHFSGSQIGLFTGITMLASLVIMPFYGIIGDKTGRYKLLLEICTAGVVVFAFLMSLQTGFALMMTMGIGFELMRCGVTPLADTQAVNYCSRTGSQFGVIRCFGPVGWVAGSAVLGLIINRWGLDNVLFRGVMGAAAAGLLFVFLFPENERIAEAKRNSGQGQTKMDIKGLFRNKAFLFLLLFASLTGVISEIISNYSGLHLVSTLGAPEALLSVNMVISSFPEIIVVFFANSKILPKLGFGNIYKISATAIVIRFLIYSFAGSPGMFLIGSCFGFLTSAVTTAVMAQYIKTIVPEEVFGSAVTFYNAVFLGMKAVYGYLYGIIYEQFGSYMIFRSTLLLVLAALVLAYTYPGFRKARGREEKEAA